VLGFAFAGQPRRLSLRGLFGFVGSFILGIGDGLGYTPPLPVYWNDGVRGKSRNNLWGSIAYG